LDILILVIPISELGNFQVALQILLTLTAASIPFAIRNTKVVGILLLILPTISFGLSVSSTAIVLDSEGISQIVGFILFVIAGIMALLHTEDDKKKKRKAFALILDFLDKINSAKEWNDRLHELNTKLRPYQAVLPSAIRHAIDNIATDSDLVELSDKLSEEYSDLTRKTASRIVKIVTISMVAILSMSFGVFAFGNFDFSALPTLPALPAFPTLPPFSLQQCSEEEHLEDRTCVSNNQSPNKGGQNHVPIANAGADQTVNEGQKVTLDGSGSRDYDGQSLKYSWKKVKGPSILFENDKEKKVTFIAPEVKKDTSFIIQLTVSDHESKSSDKVKLAVKNIAEPSSPTTPSSDFPPTVEAFGEPESVTYSDCNELQTLKLHANGKDTEGLVSYKWEQIEGDKVTFSSNDGKPEISFEAPCRQQKLMFDVTVVDNSGQTATDEVSIDVFVSPISNSIKPKLPPTSNELIKIPPTVQASSDPSSIKYQNCNSLETVNLFAKAKDTDGKIVSYKWIKQAGEGVKLEINDQWHATFEAPCRHQTISFSVTVADNDGLTNTAEVSINVSVPMVQ
jgi:hypothetical protein